MLTAGDNFSIDKNYFTTPASYKILTNDCIISLQSAKKGMRITGSFSRESDQMMILHQEWSS
jgi:hypothetical protein